MKGGIYKEILGVMSGGVQACPGYMPDLASDVGWAQTWFKNNRLLPTHSSAR